MWHLRMVARAGDTLAERLYGARRETGVALYAQAMAGPSEPVALHYGCAVALIELDPDRFADAAERMLATVKAAEARDAADNLVHAEAARLLAGLRSKPR